MEETVRDRLYKFIQYLNMSVRQFELKWGVASGYVRNISKGIGNEHLTNLCKQYPILDLNWLYTGSGSMLKNIPENYENLMQQSENYSRNSIDEIIEEKIKKAIMENIPAIISAVMEGMNKQMEGQNQVINKQLDMLQEVIRSLADLNTKSDKIHENVVKLSRRAQ